MLSIDDAVMTESLSSYLSLKNDINFLMVKMYKLYHTEVKDDILHYVSMKLKNRASLSVILLTSLSFNII